MKPDLTVLAKDVIFPADSNLTGINMNELIVGSTGSGKTFSTVIPRILNTYNSSLVIPISKPYIYELTAPLLKKRGYDIQYISLNNPERTTVSYDPLDYLVTDAEVVSFAHSIVYGSDTFASRPDPFWEDSAVNLITAVI